MVLHSSLNPEKWNRLNKLRYIMAIVLFISVLLFLTDGTVETHAAESETLINRAAGSGDVSSITENYQKFLDKENVIIEKGWTITNSHLQATADVYWLEGNTTEGAHFRYYAYPSKETYIKILASTEASESYLDLDRYWMTEGTYQKILDTGKIDIGYAGKLTYKNDQVVKKYIGYVYYKYQ